MTLTNARKLQKEIQSKNYHCIVPLGYGPRRYFCRTFRTKNGQLVPFDFRSRATFRKHHAMRLRENRRIMRFYDKMMQQQRARLRSPLDAMIDRACGLE
jgi:hypothetical protein